MTSTATYRVFVDWPGDLTFDEMVDNETPRLLASSPITIERGRDQARQLSPPMAGKTEGVELDNVDRRFSRENSTGSHYGDILPNRGLKIDVDWNSTTYALSQTFLTDITPHVEVGRRTVTLASLGSLSRLKAQSDGQRVSTALYQNITTSDALGYILDAIGWPAADRVIDTAGVSLDWWWLNEEDAFAAAVALVATEGPGATLYEDTQGRIVFESRHYRITTLRCTSAQLDVADGESYLTDPFVYNDGIRNVINVCTIEQKSRVALDDATVVWSAGQAYALTANEARAIKVTATEPFTGAIVPTSSAGDYTIAAGSLSTAALDRASGQNCTVTLTAGAGGATVTGLRLRALSVLVTATNLITNTVSSTGSQDKYGIRTFNLPVRAEISLNVAQDFCNAVTLLYKEPRPTVELNTVGQSTDALLQIFTREISDRISVSESQIGTTGDYFIERIRHSIAAGGRWHEAAFACEQASTMVWARWGSTGTIYTRWASTGFTSTDADKGVYTY